MSGRVSIYTVTFLSPDGQRPIIGGLERYIRDLACLMRGMGYAVDFLQNSTAGPWATEYEGFPVQGIPVRPDGSTDIPAFDRQAADRVLYSWIGQQQTYKYPGISICHGIWWDHPHYTEAFAEETRRTVRPALQQSRYLVAVDTAFINWCRGTMPSEIGGKLRYVPNYIDLTRFQPEPRSEDGSVTILYPRRLDYTRGIEVCYRIVPRLLAKYPQVRFKFAIDRNNEQLWQQFVAWVEAQPAKERIAYRTYGFDEMAEAYRDADIVLCPSQMSEGTSLSCLEGLACGKVVLATLVGGLTDLILDRFNGRLVNTDDDAIYDALCELIENRDLRQELGSHGALTARAFSKERWEGQWRELIAAVY